MPSPPSTGRVTSPYGPRNGAEIGPGVGPFHYGEDTDGDGNFAPVSGQIVFAGYAGNFGNAILIRDGRDVWGIAHHKNLNGRRVGQNVNEHERLAPIGATGLAFGIHAHTERRTGGGNTIQSGAHSNPRDYYNTPATVDSRPLPTPDEPVKEQTMRIIGDGKGSQKFADEFGADDIGNYFFLPGGVDGNPSWADNIRASWVLAGEPVNGRADTWDMELARHQANARWAQKRGEIVTDVVNALRPLLEQFGTAVAGLTREAIRTSIDEGLKDVVVEVEPISEEDAAKIATLSAEMTRERFRQDPQR